MSTKEKTAECPICHKEITGGCVVSNYEELVCVECTQENYFECEECESLHLNEELIYIDCDNKTVCKTCADDNYVKCDDCGEYTKESDISEINGNMVCGYCKKNNYGTCDDCGGTFRNNQLHYNSDDNRYCSDCYEEHRDCIDNYHSHRTVKFFGGDESDTDNLFLGVELEIDDGSNNNKTAKQIKGCFPKNFIFMERDGSLDDGFENITQPATLDYHMGLKNNYTDAFKIATSNGFRSHNTDTCGLHVHFNRSFFEDNEELYTARLLYIVSKFWSNMTKFSRRTYDQLERWAKQIDDTPEEFIEKNKNGNGDRYYAVNLTNSNTIEFRMFRGTLNINTYIATLQLVDTIIRVAKTSEVEQIQSMAWEDFLQYDEIKAYWETVKNR